MTPFVTANFSGTGDLSTYSPELGGPLSILFASEGYGIVPTDFVLSGGNLIFTRSGTPGAVWGFDAAPQGGAMLMEATVKFVDHPSMHGQTFLVVGDSLAGSNATAVADGSHAGGVTVSLGVFTDAEGYSSPAIAAGVALGVEFVLGLQVSADHSVYSLLVNGVVKNEYTAVGTMPSMSLAGFEVYDAFANQGLLLSRIYGESDPPPSSLFWTDFVRTQETLS